MLVSPNRKTTARNATLLTTSCHPEHVIHNVPIGELIRMKRNCTSLEVSQTHQRDVCDWLRSRLYLESTLKRAVSRVSKVTRMDLLGDKHRTPATRNCNSPFSTMFSLQHRQIVGLIRKHCLFWLQRIVCSKFWKLQCVLSLGKHLQ